MISASRLGTDLSSEFGCGVLSRNGFVEGRIVRCKPGTAPQAKTCDAILGIVDEGAEIMEEYKGSPALDAGLLAAAQAVEHYEMSRYGTLIAWAEKLELEKAVTLLSETLEEEEATDAALTELAESVVNAEAQEEAEVG